MLSPLVTTLIQSTLLNAISNIIAQVIDQYRHNKPFSLNIIPLIQFVTYAIIIIPINFSWQKSVEARFPGFPTFPWSPRGTASFGNKTGTVDHPLLPIKEKEMEEKPKDKWQAARLKPSGTRNFVIKFILDQTVASIMNITLFIVLINLLKGVSFRVTCGAICEHFVPIMIARLKYRPIVSLLMYTVVSVDRRVVFGSACGVIWGIYLNLYAVV